MVIGALGGGGPEGPKEKKKKKRVQTQTPFFLFVDTTYMEQGKIGRGPVNAVKIACRNLIYEVRC